MANKKRATLFPQEEMSARDVLRATWAALQLMEQQARAADRPQEKAKGRPRRPAADLSTVVKRRLPVAATAVEAPALPRKDRNGKATSRAWYWRY